MTIAGTPAAASLAVDSTTSCSSVLRTVLPSTLTACFFSATLRVIFLRSREPFGRPLLLPEVPFRNWCSAGGGLRPGWNSCASLMIQNLQELLVHYFDVRHIALIFRGNGGIFIRVPRRQAVGLDHCSNDGGFNTWRYREYATVLLHVLGREQSRKIALPQKFLRRRALSLKSSLAEGIHHGLVRMHSHRFTTPADRHRLFQERSDVGSILAS